MYLTKKAERIIADESVAKAEHEARRIQSAMRFVFSSPSRRAAFIVSAIFSTFLAFYLWSDNLDAKFGLLDDHQVTSWMGPAKALNYAQAKQIFRSSEAMQPGQSPRYRPVYFFLRVTETYLWRDNAKLWYATRIVLFALASTILFYLGLSHFGLLTGLLLGSLVWTAAYWDSIWSLLGPAETYACVGAFLYLWAVIAVLSASSSDRLRTVAAFVLAVGSLIASGSKENFTILFIPSALIVAFMLKAGTASFAQISAIIASIGFNLFVLNAVVRGTATSGKDIYEQNVSSSRLKKLEVLFNGQDSFWMIVLAALCLSLTVWYLARKRQDLAAIFRQTLLAPVVIVFVLYFVYASQIVFYNGYWDLNSRYAFPGELLYWGAWLVLLYGLERALDRISPSGALSMRKLAVAILACLLVWFGFDANRAFAATNRSNTIKLHAAITRAKTALTANPGSHLILYSATLNDYESIAAIKLYLDYQGLNGRVMFQMADPYSSQQWPKDLAAAIYPHLVEATRGTPGGFIPLRLDPAAGDCYRLQISGAPLKDSCISLGFVLD